MEREMERRPKNYHEIWIDEPDSHNDMWRDHIKARRFGKFYIHDSILMEYPGEVQTLLSTMLVLSIIRDCIAEYREYQAVSPHFEPVKLGLASPEYIVAFHQTRIYQGKGYHHWIELRKAGVE